MSNFLRVARGSLRAAQFQELEQAWKKRGEMIAELESTLEAKDFLLAQERERADSLELEVDRLSDALKKARSPK